MSMINLKINGKNITCEAGKTIYEAAKENGIDIPTLCHNDQLKPFTSCFICIVELKGHPLPVPSCSTKAAEGMDITTESHYIKEARKTCLELLLSDHCGDCFSPCTIECPANCDVQSYVQHIYRGEYEEAVKVIKDTIPIPASIGRVCPALCEAVCRRNPKGGPVGICSLKRFAADKDLEIKTPYVPSTAPSTGKKVAVIGAGPAGLSGAYQLKIMGHEVDIFEAQPKGGGMLRYGIPQYRLPKETLDSEIGLIEKMGVKIHYNNKLGKDIKFEDLQKKYDAVLLAIGAWSASKMRAPGEDAQGVYPGINFLYRVANNEKINVGKEVIVVGGGNTAIDAARTALRMGNPKVTIVYRRTRAEMPALEFEIEEAEHENIEFKFLAAPIKVEKNKDEKLLLHCVKMKLGEPDATGRRKPIEMPGSEFALEADTIISAIGQKVDSTELKNMSIALTKWDTVLVNPDTLHTNIKNVFSAGDCVSGPDLAVRAIGGGKLAAKSIDQFLKGEEITGIHHDYNVSRGKIEDVDEEFYINAKDIKKQKNSEIPVEKRTKTFEEVVATFSDEAALQETQRCLECGCDKTHDCRLRQLAETYEVDPKKFIGARKPSLVDESHPKIKIEYSKCILCGLCVRYCSEIKNIHALGFAYRGFKTMVTPPFGKPLAETKCDDCMECVKICPTGALTEKLMIKQESETTPAARSECRATVAK
ncbi:MAG: FAD-dependent oxidoreductase [Armatimonadota bacterium]